MTCVAAENVLVDKQLEFLKSFKLRPIVVNISADALGNLLKMLGRNGYAAVLDVGVKQSYLNFYREGMLQFSREIPIGGEQLTQGMQKALAVLNPGRDAILLMYRK